MLVVNLMPRFRALGHEVGVVVFNGQQTPLMERLERECPECKIYRLGTGYYNPWYIVKLIRIMRQYDVVHTHNSSPQLFAAIANIFCHKRLVTTEHNTYNRKRDNWLYSQLDKWMYPRYEKIICISDQAEENLREYLGLRRKKEEGRCKNMNKNENGTQISQIPQINNENEDENENNQEQGENKVNVNVNVKKICTIYNGVDIEAIHEAAPLEELKTKRFVAVMVARFRPQKDQDTLIKAMTLLPKEQYEVWLVGDGERRESLEWRVESLGMQDSVKFLGLRTDVPNILKTADVVVMSSHWEGFGLAAVEGMSACKPVVANNVDGISQIVNHYGHIFPTEDAQALADIIRRLHDDPELYAQTAARCYERAKQFDISVMVERYNEVYW